MITTRNQFETVPAFTHIAGCSLGTWSPRDTACEMVNVLHRVSEYDCSELWRDIATENDDGEHLTDIQDEIAELLNDYLPMPEFCSVTLDDGEYRVTPSIENADEDCENFSDYQDKYKGDFILVTNDHGNVTCQRWEQNAEDFNMEYVTIWEMV